MTTSGSARRRPAVRLAENCTPRLRGCSRPRRAPARWGPPAATRDALKGLDLADRIPSGIVHINDQTVNDEANSLFGGVGASGTGSRFGGGAANVEAFTETRWVTMRSLPPTYPF